MLINHSVTYRFSDSALDAIFSALADPTRRAILGRLSSGEATVSELAEPFSVSLPAISKHIKVLERAGLISRGRNAQQRPCRLEAATLKEITNWVKAYHKLRDDQFDNLENFINKT